MKPAEAPFLDLVPVAALEALCSPFDGVCWRGLATPITKTEIEEAVQQWDFLPPGEGECTIRDDHVRRVAWFVVHGWSDPIDLDVGVPALGCVVAWPVTDGNHRFAAAIFRGDLTISADISGSLSHAEDLGLK